MSTSGAPRSFSGGVHKFVFVVASKDAKKSTLRELFTMLQASSVLQMSNSFRAQKTKCFRKSDF